MNRRQTLSVLGGYLMAGCLSIGTSRDTPRSKGQTTSGKDSTATDGYIRPESDPENIPSNLKCERENAVRITPGYSATAVTWGDTENFALRVSEDVVEQGEVAKITLTNVSSDSVETGNDTKYNLELYTESGWRDIRVSPDGTPKPYQDEGVTHDPGEGFSWEIEMNKEGVRDAPIQDSELIVCPELKLGRYRFVYWGTLGEPDIAIAFDLKAPEEY